MQRKLTLVGFAVFCFLSFSNNALAQTYSDLHDFNCAIEGCGVYHPHLLAQGRDGALYGTLYSGGTYIDSGTAFRATTSGATTTLYNFHGQNGIHPTSGLTLGTDGNFYGAASAGGVYGSGTVFRISPTGVHTILHSFADSEGMPLGPPIQGTDGSFYGVAASNLVGSAYKITLKGVFKTISNAIPPYAVGPLIQASDGNFYGISVGGMGLSCGSVFKISATGNVHTIHSFDVSHHGCNPNGPLVQDAGGYLYGTTIYGGSYNSGVLFKLSTKGAITVIHDFEYTTGDIPYAGLVLATDGNLYGATTGGGLLNYGVLFKVTTAGEYTVLSEGIHPPYGIFFAPTQMHHTNGKIYGLAGGGAYNGGAVLYSLDVGLGPFVKLMTTRGKPGQSVGILGQGFTGATSVKFGSGPGSFTVVNDTYIMAVVPTSGTTGDVKVSTPSGILTSNRIFKVIPVIQSFIPASGPVGSQVTITGGGFYGATKVTFGGVKATSFSVDSGSQITATVPTGAVTGKIKVTAPGGTATSKGTFTVT